MSAQAGPTSHSGPALPTAMLLWYQTPFDAQSMMHTFLPTFAAPDVADPTRARIGGNEVFAAQPSLILRPPQTGDHQHPEAPEAPDKDQGAQQNPPPHPVSPLTRRPRGHPLRGHKKVHWNSNRPEITPCGTWTPSTTSLDPPWAKMNDLVG